MALQFLYTSAVQGLLGGGSMMDHYFNGSPPDDQSVSVGGSFIRVQLDIFFDSVVALTAYEPNKLTYLIETPHSASITKELVDFA